MQKLQVIFQVAICIILLEHFPLFVFSMVDLIRNTPLQRAKEKDDLDSSQSSVIGSKSLLSSDDEYKPYDLPLKTVQKNDNNTKPTLPVKRKAQSLLNPHVKR